MLPNAVKVSALEVLHPDYTYYKDTWLTIQDIREGATTILRKLDTYLPRRPDEPESLYRLRCRKASYTPVATTAIRELATKVMSAPLNIVGDDSDFWQVFHEDTNGKGQDTNELLMAIVSSLLYFGRVYVAVDRPVLDKALRSKYEEAGHRLAPLVHIFEPLNVINWGEDWVLTRQIDTVTEPLKPNRVEATWCVFDDQAVSKYQAEVRLDPYGNITEVRSVDGIWLTSLNHNAYVSLTSQTYHGLGVNPMIGMALPEEMWTGNNVYSKQLQHFIIESSWTDAGSMAGVIQRVFTPTPPTPQLDERVVYEEPDYSQIQTGNQHILIGSDFKFQESPGSAIANLTSQLETIERQIRATVSMTQSSITKEALEQSGASKAMEQKPLEDAMKAYGAKLARLYQKILGVVAKMGGQAEVTVVGLSEYGDESLGTMLEQSEMLLQVEAKVPPTALKLWYGKVANRLAGSRDADTDSQIQEELDQIDYSATDGEELEATPENIKKMRQMFGMTEAQAKEVLSGKAKTKGQ